MKPLLTVITVCFNTESTIRNCIESVACGKTADVEYLIIDGASTDSTLTIARQYSGAIDFLVSEPDNGIFDAMNKGLALAKGEFVAFLNADDLYLPTTISIVLDAIRKDKNNVDVFYGDWIGVNGRGEEILRKAEHRLRSRYMLCHQAMIARRSIFPSPNGFNCRYQFCADFDLILWWQAKRFRFKRIPNQLVRFSEVGASSRYYMKSSLESMLIVIFRGRSPWNLLLLIRGLAFLIKTTIFYWIKTCQTYLMSWVKTIW
jgi:glycosyltransferase involved in cell wall biosynthesis